MPSANQDGIFPRFVPSNADALIVCVADTNSWEESKITHIKNPALNPALQCEKGLLIRTMEQVIYPISYMMLTAESLGVSSCIIGAMGSEITQIEQELYVDVREKLGLKDGQILSTIITLGYDANPTETVKQRKEFNDVVSLEKLGNNF